MRERRSRLKIKVAAACTLFAVVLSAIVIFMHRANIKRLLNGTEKPFGKKKK